MNGQDKAKLQVAIRRYLHREFCQEDAGHVILNELALGMTNAAESVFDGVDKCLSKKLENVTGRCGITEA